MRVRQSPGRFSIARVTIWICLAAAFVGPLAAPLSMRTEPRLLGWPFFYWYQVVWVPLGAVLLTCAYVLGRRSRGSSDSPPGQGG